ncbi:MAG: pantetheine-phosphate adenylyltransferase [Muribaculaceae bacterium]|nr:pantetheine-phosphate adenylyltransferase [Muribaculaceae bacterium]
MRKAVFPGSFDPFTVGHKDIADRALRIFDHLVIGVGYNIHKASGNSIAERVEGIKAVFAGDSRISVEAYTGLTVDFARRHGAAFIVRGLREVKDFEYERNLADINAAISDIETVFLTARPELGFVSSSMVRELQANGYDASRFLPKKEEF